MSTTNYPYEYENDEKCTIRILSEVHVFAESFEIEIGYHGPIDRFSITDEGSVEVISTIDEIPRRLSAGNSIEWTTDFSIVRNGWKLCFEETGLEDEPFTIYGNCEVRNECLSSSSYGRGSYSNNEDCFITMLMDAEISVSALFSIETCCDKFKIDGVEIHTPEEIPRTFSAGTTIEWHTDSSIVSDGWELCLSTIAEEIKEYGNFEQDCMIF